MPYRPEPPEPSVTASRVAVLLVNLGTPDAPTAPALRRYLAEFLSDPRVVEIPGWLWKPILYGVILQVRPAKSAAKYATVWTPEGSPLAVWTARQAELIEQALAARGQPIAVRPAMRYGSPSIADVLAGLRRDGATRILVFPLYPQYAGATTGSVFDAVAQWGLRARHVPEFRFVHRYHDEPAYIGALAASVREHWDREGRGEALVMSFHGIPERSEKLGDPYSHECRQTARLLADRLGIAAQAHHVTFQSRFGKATWLQPYTEPTLRELARRGLRTVDVICPGFAADCLETLEEIAGEAKEAFLEAGGAALRYIPCLNDRADGIAAMAGVIERHLQGWTACPE